MSPGRSCDVGHRGRAIVGERGARRERGGDHGAAPAARTAREVDAREAAEERAPVLVVGGHGRGSEESAGALAVGRRRATRREEAEVADLDEARGEDVEEEAADEFVRGETDRAPELRGEAHAGGVGGEEAVVREADAVGIAAEVAKDLRGAGERALRVDDPVVAVELLFEADEGPWVGELGAGAGEIESARGVLAGEGGKELPAEQAGEDAHKQEMVGARTEPARPIGGQPAAGDEAVEVGVELEVARPRVEHGGHPEASAEATGVEAEGEERAGGGPEEEREEAAAMAQDERAEP